MKQIDKEDQEVLFLNGYLSALVHLNSYCNDIINVSISKHEITNETDLLTFLKQEFQSTKLNFRRTVKFEREFSGILKKYVERFITKIAESRNYPFWELTENERNEILKKEKEPIEDVDFKGDIIRRLNKLISNDDDIYIVIAENCTELYGIIKDGLIIRNEKRILLLKLAYSD